MLWRARGDSNTQPPYLSTGEQVGEWANRYAYPFRWYYGVLNAAECFRQASLIDGRQADLRMAEAIEVIHAARQPDGIWIQERRHPGLVWFDVEVPAAEPSKWLTQYPTGCSTGGMTPRP